MFDTHIHTENSHDSKQTADEICSFAIDNGIGGVNFTDHVDIGIYTDDENFSTARKVFDDVSLAKRRYGRNLKILSGIELGGYFNNPEIALKLCQAADFDIILGSVHAFPFREGVMRLSMECLDENTQIDYLVEIIDAYLSFALIVAQNAPIDTLCHITYPFRYINGKYKRNISSALFEDKIKEIMKTLIERQVALEMNTSGINSYYGETLPSFDLIKKYFDLGGRLITLGSDAHITDRIANGFDTVRPLLKEMGFERYYYFEKRKPISVKI